MPQLLLLLVVRMCWKLWWSPGCPMYMGMTASWVVFKWPMRKMGPIEMVSSGPSLLRIQSHSKQSLVTDLQFFCDFLLFYSIVIEDNIFVIILWFVSMSETNGEEIFIIIFFLGFRNWLQEEVWWVCQKNHCPLEVKQLLACSIIIPSFMNQEISNNIQVTINVMSISK